MSTRVVIFAALMCLTFGPRASGHHPLAELYERDNIIVLTGTVTAVEWVNPHVVVTMAVTSDAREAGWRVELDPPGALQRRGWSRDRVTAGDRITVTAHPSKDGGPAAAARTVRLPSGNELVASTDSSWNWGRVERVPSRR